MIKYPNGQKYQPLVNKSNRKSKIQISVSSANRGMDLEEDINFSNEYYSLHNLCLITKRPTPIKIVKVDYSKGAKIVDAYFEKQSTTDYNGVYKGKYIDFEAKTTNSKTSFPLSNISKHQIEHLKKVLQNDGIAFFIIEFRTYKEVYLIDASFIINFYESKERQSIPYSVIKKEGELLKISLSPRIDYLSAIDKKYL